MTDIIPAAQGWFLLVPSGRPGHFDEFPLISWDVGGEPAPGMAWGWRLPDPNCILRDPNCNFYSMQNGKWQPQDRALTVRICAES